MGLYIEIKYGGDWWGEEPLSETGFETTGELYAALSGRAKMYSYRALGRCTGKVYVDTADCADCRFDRSYHYQYADAVTGHPFRAKPRQVGWSFVARNPEPVNRGDRQPTGLREAWVIVYDAPPTVVATQHYTRFGARDV